MCGNMTSNFRLLCLSSGQRFLIGSQERRVGSRRVSAQNEASGSVWLAYKKLPGSSATTYGIRASASVDLPDPVGAMKTTCRVSESAAHSSGAISQGVWSGSKEDALSEFWIRTCFAAHLDSFIFVGGRHATHAPAFTAELIIDRVQRIRLIGG